jgi:hypothetical protein
MAVGVGKMTEQKYVGVGSQAAVWHTQKDCKMAHETELVPVEDSEIPDAATRCTNCANGLTAHDLEEMGENA